MLGGVAGEAGSVHRRGHTLRDQNEGRRSLLRLMAWAPRMGGA